MKGDQLTWRWVDNSGFGSTTDAIEHLPDCTGFDWEEPHQWNVGDWFVVDEKHERNDLWVEDMGDYLGIPQRVVCIHADGDLRSNGLWWDQSWCRPCAPPKAEPAPPRFQPSIEYVGIHDEE